MTSSPVSHSPLLVIVADLVSKKLHLMWVTSKIEQLRAMLDALLASDKTSACAKCMMQLVNVELGRTGLSCHGQHVE